MAKQSREAAYTYALKKLNGDTAKAAKFADMYERASTNLEPKTFGGRVGLGKSADSSRSARLHRALDAVLEKTKKRRECDEPMGPKDWGVRCAACRKDMKPITSRTKDADGVRIVHNKLLGGWYVVRGSAQTPLGGKHASKAEAQAWLDRNKAKDAVLGLTSAEIKEEIKAIRPQLAGQAGIALKREKPARYAELEKRLTELLGAARDTIRAKDAFKKIDPKTALKRIESKGGEKQIWERDTEKGAVKTVKREAAAGLSAKQIEKKYGFSLSWIQEVMGGKAKDERDPKQKPVNMAPIAKVIPRSKRPAEDLKPVGEGEVRGLAKAVYKEATAIGKQLQDLLKREQSAAMRKDGASEAKSLRKQYDALSRKLESMGVDPVVDHAGVFLYFPDGSSKKA